MNFDNLPPMKNPYGYLYVLGFTLIISLFLVYLFIRKMVVGEKVFIRKISYYQLIYVKIIIEYYGRGVKDLGDVYHLSNTMEKDLTKNMS